MTKRESLERLIKQLEDASQSLKEGHSHGDWERWRRFTGLDIKANEYRIKLLELENEALLEALEDYKDY